MTGRVDRLGRPVLTRSIAGRDWTALIDTGFNGELDLPEELARHFPGLIWGQAEVTITGGRKMTEDTFVIDFPFDGDTVAARTVYNPTDEIVIGTGLIKDYRLTIDFRAGTVLLERLPPARLAHADSGDGADSSIAQRTHPLRGAISLSAAGFGSGEA